MRSPTREEVDFARSPTVWDLGNQVLYDMCRSFPEHDTHQKVVSKIWLIGRSYAASIERRKNAFHTGDSFYLEVVAPGIQKSAIDSWLNEITEEEPGSAKTITAHNKLLEVLFSITGLRKRSLASKYLHFHKPGAFFLYDSRARQSIMEFTPPFSCIPMINLKEFDREYRDFVRRCLWLWNNIRETFGVKLSPREIDNLLLNISSGGINERTRKHQEKILHEKG